MADSHTKRLRAWGLALFAAWLISGCGGGGGNPGNCMSGGAQTCAGTSTPSPTPAASTSSEALAGICTLQGAKNFTRAYLQETYLWYSEIPAADPAAYTDLAAYFYALLTPALDSFGQPKDRFSFIVTATDADSLLTGSNVGYGAHWRNDALGRTRAAFIDAGSPAARAGLERGGELVTVLTPGAKLFPNEAASISFVYRSAPGAATRTVTLDTAAIQEDPLPLTQTLLSASGRKVGYLLFNAHTLGAQDKLIPALQNAQAAGVQDLVLDLRYNGGGYLRTALTLSSMLASSRADNQIFEQLRFNDKRGAETQAATIRFSGAVQYGESLFPTGTALPRLGLPRVYALTSEETCSASESVINSLRGVGITVVLIGRTTCGKPYGFSRRDNCGVSYFPIEFQGVNAIGFGDYANGFSPTCELADDFDHALGSSSERLLAAALFHVDSGSCPMQSMSSALPARGAARVPGQPVLRGKVLAPARH